MSTVLTPGRPRHGGRRGPGARWWLAGLAAVALALAVLLGLMASAASGPALARRPRVVAHHPRPAPLPTYGWKAAPRISGWR